VYISIGSGFRRDFAVEFVFHRWKKLVSQIALLHGRQSTGYLRTLLHAATHLPIRLSGEGDNLREDERTKAFSNGPHLLGTLFGLFFPNLCRKLREAIHISYYPVL
jgi:hypothetical protein